MKKNINNLFNSLLQFILSQISFISYKNPFKNVKHKHKLKYNLKIQDYRKM